MNGRAQWETKQAALQERRSASSEGGKREQPDHPSCSRNAHDKNVLVRRAQGKPVWLLPLREV
jgi:hypothetical protein